MYISEILELNKNDKEADVYVSDGNYNIMCYIYPIDSVQIGAVIKKIITYGCKKITRTNDCLFNVEKLSDYYSYFITAKVKSREENLVVIGNILVQLDDYIPNDISDEEYVSFFVERFDAVV